MVGADRNGTALLDLMVGEPVAYVQGYPPKGHGAVWYGFQLPDHQGSQEKGGGEPHLSTSVTDELLSPAGEAHQGSTPLGGGVGGLMAKLPLPADPVDVEVGANIKRRRRASGLSQTELGEALSVSFQQVQKYENGRNRVSASALQKIADVLRVPVSRLFPARAAGRFQEPASCGAAEDAAQKPENRDLDMAFSSIKSAEVKNQIVGLVQAIAAELADKRGVR